MTAIAGTKVTLRRARDTDRARIYEWHIGSDLTANLMGPPMFPDRSIPSPEQFSQSYPRHFYEGTRPYAGRMYVITVQGEEIGCISHGAIDVLNDVVELDIWLSERRVAGHGYGSESLGRAMRLAAGELRRQSFPRPALAAQRQGAARDAARWIP